MKTRINFKRTCVLCACLLTNGIAHAAIVFEITEMQLLDSGGGATIVSDPNHSQATTGVITKTGNGGVISNVSGELNLQTFKAGGTTYLANQFVSGVGPDTVISPDQLGYVLQPADYIAKTTAGGTGRTTSNNSGFFAGSVDANGDLVNGASYLISGERGLSYSTSLNYRPSADDAQTLSFPLSFKADPLGLGVNRPTFFAGDGANNQEPDGWRFLNANGDTIAQLTISSSDWTQFGQHTVDRLSTNWNGNANNFDDDLDVDMNPLNIALLAFKLSSADFMIGGEDKSDQWADITTLELILPLDQNTNPRTDYSFIGIDRGLVTSPNAVPEPSTSMLLGVFGICLAFRRSR